MKLSIIVISYNESKYLGAALESCLKQEGGHELEIIIGDDGSSDGSIDIIREYQEKYPEIIRYFVMERNNPQNVIPSLRVSNVIKRGFFLATGDYLMVMSGDDLLVADNKCRMQIHFLEKHPGYSACYTNYMKFWDSGEKDVLKNYPLGFNALFWSRYYAHITCFVFRRSVLENLTKTFCDDTGLIFSILKTGKIAYLPVVAFGYRQRPVSIMSSSNEMELNLLELLLLQDLLESKGYFFSSLSRCSKPLAFVFRNKEALSDQKYAKYLNHSKVYSNNILEMMHSYNSLSFTGRLQLQALLLVSWLSRKFFAICSLKDRLANR